MGEISLHNAIIDKCYWKPKGHELIIERHNWAHKIHDEDRPKQQNCVEVRQTILK
jgi:hypothetical protein